MAPIVIVLITVIPGATVLDEDSGPPMKLSKSDEGDRTKGGEFNIFETGQYGTVRNRSRTVRDSPGQSGRRKIEFVPKVSHKSQRGRTLKSWRLKIISYCSGLC